MKERCLHTQICILHIAALPLLISLQQGVLFDPAILTQLYQLVPENKSNKPTLRNIPSLIAYET